MLSFLEKGWGVYGCSSAWVCEIMAADPSRKPKWCMEQARAPRERGMVSKEISRANDFCDLESRFRKLERWVSDLRALVAYMEDLNSVIRSHMLAYSHL